MEPRVVTRLDVIFTQSADVNRTEETFVLRWEREDLLAREKPQGTRTDREAICTTFIRCEN